MRTAPHAAFGWHVKAGHVKDAALGVVQCVAEDLAFGAPGGARPPCHDTTTATVFAQLVLRWRRNWAAQWHLARAVGKRFRGCRAKRLYV